MHFRIGTLTIFAALFAAGSLSAHHSSVFFDLSKTFMLTGAITKVDWRNPHVVISMEAKNAGSKAEVWELESGAPSWFKGRSLGRGDFDKAVGQVVTVEGVRAKDGSRYGYLFQIKFSDGSSWELR
jgi:hypothetical protein